MRKKVRKTQKEKERNREREVRDRQKERERERDDPAYTKSRRITNSPLKFGLLETLPVLNFGP